MYITKEQLDLIPFSVRRRMTKKDFGVLDDIIHNNRRYYVAQDFDRYLDGNLRDSLNEFIHDYKVEEIDPNLDNDDWDDEENTKYKIFWQLIPFLKKKYYDDLYYYHTEYNKRRGNMNESKKDLYNLIPQSVKRRIGEDNLNKIDMLLSSNKKSYLGSLTFSDYLDNLIVGTLVDFINYYVMPEIDPNFELNDDEADDAWDKTWELYTKLVPFLKKKYGSDKDLSDYYKINRQ